MRNITLAEENWLRTKTMPNYLIYSKSNGTVYCASCNAEYESKQLTTRKIGAVTKCACCGKDSKIKNKKYTASSWEYGTAIIPDREDDRFILRYFHIFRHFNTGWRTSEIKYRECFREEYNCSLNGKLTVTDRKWEEDEWRKCKLPDDNYRVSYYTHRPIGTHVNLPNDNVSVYTENITDYLKGTPIERVPLYKILNGIKLTSRYDVYAILFDTFHGYANFFEYIFKVGVENLAYQLVQKNPYKYINSNVKSLIDMLSLSKETYRELLQLGNKATINDLNRLQKYTEFKLTNQRDREVFDKFLASEPYKAKELLEILPMSLNKFGRWAETQKFNCHTYIDYLNMCKELGLDMKNTFVSMPKELNSAHDMVTDMYNEMKFDIKLKKYADEANQYVSEYEKIVPINTQKYKFEDNTMQIVVPKTTRDIGHEGYKLRHCVAQYMGDVVANKKTILFVRNKKEIDVPYFTMEIIGNQITQCKGYRNCPRPIEVEKFLKSFARNKHLSIAKNEHFAAVM